MIRTYELDFKVDISVPDGPTFIDFKLVMGRVDSRSNNLKEMVDFAVRRDVGQLTGVTVELQPLVQLPEKVEVDPRLSELGLLLEPGRLAVYKHPVLESVLPDIWDAARATASADTVIAEALMSSNIDVDVERNVIVTLDDLAQDVFRDVSKRLLAADWRGDLVTGDPLASRSVLCDWVVSIKKGALHVRATGFMVDMLNDWTDSSLQWYGPTFKIAVQDLDYAVKILNVGQCSKMDDLKVSLKAGNNEPMPYVARPASERHLVASSVEQMHTLIQECKTHYWQRCVADEVEQATWQQRLVACQINDKLFTASDDVMAVKAGSWSDQMLIIIWWLDAGSKTEQMESVFGPQVTVRVHAVMRDHCAFGEKLRNRKRLSDEDRLRVEHDLPEVNELLTSVGSSSLIVDADGPMVRSDLFKAVAIDVRRPLWIQLLQFVEFASRVLVTACCLPDNRRVDLNHARIAMQEIQKSLAGVSRWFDLNRCTASDFGFKGTVYLSQAMQACDNLPAEADLLVYRERADLIYSCFSGIKFTSSSDLTKLVSKWPLHDLSGVSDKIMGHKLRPNAKGRIVDTFNLEANGLFTDPVVPTLIEAAIKNQANESGLDLLR